MHKYLIGLIKKTLSGIYESLECVKNQPQSNVFRVTGFVDMNEFEQDDDNE